MITLALLTCQRSRRQRGFHFTSWNGLPPPLRAGQQISTELKGAAPSLNHTTDKRSKLVATPPTPPPAAAAAPVHHGRAYVAAAEVV